MEGSRNALEFFGFDGFALLEFPEFGADFLYFLMGEEDGKVGTI